MSRHRESESEDRRLVWQLIFATVVVAVVALEWPDRYKPPYPWREPVFDAVLWSILFLIACKSLLKQWKFWIALPFGIAAQVWAEKALIVSGVYLRPRTSKLMALIGMIVWAVLSLLLTRISRGMGIEESTAEQEPNGEL